MPATKTTRRRRPKPIHGTSEYLDPPEWRPLLHHVGPFLARWFMYMCTVNLDNDGGRVHAYRHVETREYFHIHDDLRCFSYEGDKQYLELPRSRTIFRVFGDYGMYPHETEEEFDRYRDAVLVAEYLAHLRDEDPVGEAPPEGMGIVRAA